MPMTPTKGQRVKPYRPPKDPSKTRISAHLKTAIHEIIHNGRTRAQAAEIAGIKDDTLYRALLKPDVLRYKNEVMRAFRESEIERSFTKMTSLRETAKSEHVQADMAKTIASFDERFQPGQRVTHGGQINVRSVGYVIDLRDDKSQLTSDQVIDGEFTKVDQ